ncbi:MAG: hypothetical protein A2X12_08920 [Bacteroidetes bacterium GWE2_29_8]|nr:MAG: hypothetical protein A2X12_08920 [Bacteroidetes bacterium GWE2_29_8]OFY23324.1 MAG: hypothetical protein A2X02_08635 [Bacteroidetes bacterium GWF2_29_10]
MNDFEDGMFKYLTEPTNYKSANELSSLLVSINERLKQEFWDSVSMNLKEELNKKELIVEYERNGNSFLFKVVKSDWKEIAIAFDEELDIGLKINKKCFSKEDIVRIAEKYKEELPQIQNENEEWLCYKKIENSNFYQFSSFQDLFQILPNNRDKFINKIVDDLASFTINALAICDEINKLKRK